MTSFPLGLWLRASSIGHEKNYTEMTHTQVNFSVSPRPEIGVPALLLKLGVRLVNQVYV